MATSIDYTTVPHETIYQHITGGPGSAALADVSGDCQGLATKLQALQDLVDQAVSGIGAAQQGEAADAATQATMALIPWLGDLVTAASRAAAQASEQSAFFGYTRDNMPEPRTIPDVSFNQDPETWMADHALEWLPGIQTEHERDLVAAQQAEQRARELMNGYQGSSNENLAVPPYFPTAPEVVFDVTPPAPDGVGIVGGNAGWGTQQRPAPSDLAPSDLPYPLQAHLASAHPGPVPGGPDASAAPADIAAQLGSGVDQASTPASTVAQLAGGHPSSGEELMAGSGPAPLAAATPFLAGSIIAGGNRGRGGSRFSGAGGQTPDEGFGPRPSTGRASTEYGNTGHGNPEHGNAGRAAGGGAGWADVPLGAPGGCAPAGDTAHRRPSYLIEQDTNALVGELPRVAPPVIGADEDYH